MAVRACHQPCLRKGKAMTARLPMWSGHAKTSGWARVSISFDRLSLLSLAVLSPSPDNRAGSMEVYVKPTTMAELMFGRFEKLEVGQY